MAIMEDIHDKERELNLNNEAFKTSEHISEANKQIIQKFCDKCFAEGPSKSRVGKYISNFHTIFKLAPEEFDLETAEREELETVVARIQQSDYSEATKSDFKTAIKKFYKVMEGGGSDYPDKVQFINTHRDQTKEEMPDILEREEVEEIIQACKNDREKAMYKVLYEGGLRAGELMALRIKDVKFDDLGVKLLNPEDNRNRYYRITESGKEILKE